jgi:hypothetical protein
MTLPAVTAGRYTASFTATVSSQTPATGFSVLCQIFTGDSLSPTQLGRGRVASTNIAKGLAIQSAFQLTSTGDVWMSCSAGSYAASVSNSANLTLVPVSAIR